MNASVRSAVEKAVSHMGSQRALARALGISGVAVGQWGREGASARGVPPKQCVRIEVLTAGAVTRRDLRPDDWHLIWPELADSGTNPAQTFARQALPAIKTIVSCNTDEG